MKILYYDCFAGISGDMHLGAMIDAGVDPDHLTSELKKLPVTGFRLNICRDKKQSIEGTRVDVILDDGHDQGHGHDDKHSHSHGHNEKHGHAHAHEHGHEHDHDHGHGRQKGSHEHSTGGTSNHVHRNLDDITSIITQSGLPEATQKRALNMFQRIAVAEAKIHGVSIDEIHFHEVGALDSIVDIIGAAICLEYLNPDRILCSTVELGSGTIRCAHGIMPVPAPATAEILKDIPVKTGGTSHEATTPTGAAILAASVDEFTDRPVFRPRKTAYGIGQRDAKLPNVLRVFVGDADDLSEKSSSEDAGFAEIRDQDRVKKNASSEIDGKVMIECNIDDMNPEHYPHVMDMLLSKGASDVCLTPTIMKKGRPGIIISVLCDQAMLQDVSETILKETTTLGVRSYPVFRTMLDRELETFESTLGPVTFKKAYLNGRLLKWKAEFNDCKKLADKHDLSISEVNRRLDLEFSGHIHQGGQVRSSQNELSDTRQGEPSATRQSESDPADNPEPFKTHQR